MSRVFLDANVLIYAMEADAERGPRVRQLLEAMARRHDTLCTSALVSAEVQAGAELMGSDALRASYHRLLSSPGWEILPFTDKEVPHFVRLRAHARVKAPDAIHLACAAARGVDVFLTHDARLTRLHVPGIQFIVGLDTDIFGC